jgi:hypothetical protein
MNALPEVFTTRILLPEMPTHTDYLRAKPQLQIRDGRERRILLCRQCSEESQEQQLILGPPVLRLHIVIDRYSKTMSQRRNQCAPDPGAQLGLGNF